MFWNQKSSKRRSASSSSINTFEKLEPRQLLCVALSGSISQDTTFDPVSNNYCLTGDLTVDAGATLTLNPGVEIEFRNLANQLSIFGNVVGEDASLSRGEFGLGKVLVYVGDGGNLDLNGGVISPRSVIRVDNGGSFVADSTEFARAPVLNLHEIEVLAGGTVFGTNLNWESDVDQGARRGVVVRDGGSLTFENSSFDNFILFEAGAMGGIFDSTLVRQLENFSTDVSITGNDFLQHDTPVSTSPYLVAGLDTNTFESHQTIGLRNGRDDASATFADLKQISNLTNYRLDASFFIGAGQTWLVQPEVTLSSGSLQVRGIFDVQGTIDIHNVRVRDGGWMRAFSADVEFVRVWDGGRFNVIDSQVRSVDYEPGSEGNLVGSEFEHADLLSNLFISQSSFNRTLSISPLSVWSLTNQNNTLALDSQSITLTGVVPEGREIFLDSVPGHQYISGQSVASNTVGDLQVYGRLDIRPGVVIRQFGFPEVHVYQGGEFYVTDAALLGYLIDVNEGGRAGVINVSQGNGNERIEYQPGSFGSVINSPAWTDITLLSNNVWLRDIALDSLTIAATRAEILGFQALGISFSSGSIVDLVGDIDQDSTISGVPNVQYRLDSTDGFVITRGSRLTTRNGATFVDDDVPTEFIVEGQLFSTDTRWENSEFTVASTGFANLTNSEIMRAPVDVDGRLAVFGSTINSRIDVAGGGVLNAADSLLGGITSV